MILNVSRALPDHDAKAESLYRRLVAFAQKAAETAETLAKDADVRRFVLAGIARDPTVRIITEQGDRALAYRGTLIPTDAERLLRKMAWGGAEARGQHWAAVASRLNVTVQALNIVFGRASSALAALTSALDSPSRIARALARG